MWFGSFVSPGSCTGSWDRYTPAATKWVTFPRIGQVGFLLVVS